MNEVTHLHNFHSVWTCNLLYTNIVLQDVLSSMMEYRYAGSHHCSNHMDVILINIQITHSIHNDKMQNLNKNGLNSTNILDF